MTLRSFINFGDALNKVAGVNICVRDNDELDISYCVLKKEKELIKIVKAAQHLTRLTDVCDQLKEYLPEGAGIHVNFDGNGLLRKALSSQEISGDIPTLTGKTFPLVKPEEFIGQLSKTRERNFLSIIRIDVLELIKILNDRYSVVDISLGVFVIGPITALLKTSELNIGSSLIQIADAKITDIITTSEDKESNVVVDEQVLTGSQLLAYASALSLFTQYRDWTVSSIKSVTDRRIDFNFNKNLYRASRVALLVVLGILLINTVGYLSLQSEVEKLRSSLEFSASQSEARQKSQKETGALVSSYEKLGWTSNVKPLFYCDQLALNVTEAIVLTNLEVGVLDHELLKKEKRTWFQSNLIKVQGTAIDPVSLQQWIEEIEKLYWVDRVYDEKYQHDRRSGKGVFEFYITAK